MSDSAWLECVLVKNISFSIPGLCHGQKRPFKYVWNAMALVICG
jgi:hypothetical protein